MPKICLSMIVKNEERVIRRCLESVLPYIDAWAIVDTGSTDRTMEIIREVMADVDGVLLEREWVDNFGVSRTQALEAARSSGCDYALVQDADDVFSAPEGFVWPEDMGDGGMLPHFLGEMEYWRTQLLKLERAWEYRGVVHEYPVIPGEHERLVRVVGPSVTITREGARSTFSVEEKYGHDAKLLRQALEENPGDTRSAFYLAQSLRDAGRYEEAQVAYRRRARMGGFAEEVWVSMFQVALIEQHLDRLDWELVAELFVQAYEFRPSRVEPLLSLAEGYRRRGKHAKAFIYSTAAVTTPDCNDLLFVDRTAATWRKFDELSMAAHGLGYGDVALATCDYAMRVAPQHQLQRLRLNMSFFPQSPAGFFQVQDLQDGDLARWIPMIKGLRTDYKDVTQPGYPASDQVLALTCATLASLVKKLGGERVVRVLDMGSGLSSAVLRKCAADASILGDVDILSVDDSEEWLEKTRQFLESKKLTTTGMAEWSTVRYSLEPFDLVFFDLGTIPTRQAEMAYAMCLGSTVILNDMHLPELQNAARQALSHIDIPWALFDLQPITHDCFKRFAWAVAFRPKVNVVVKNSTSVIAAQ